VSTLASCLIVVVLTPVAIGYAAAIVAAAVWLWDASRGYR